MDSDSHCLAELILYAEGVVLGANLYVEVIAKLITSKVPVHNSQTLKFQHRRVARAL